MRARFVYMAAGVLTLAAIYSCCTGTPLIWDGAYQFDASLIHQSPFVYRSRFHTLFLWQPFVLLSRYTDNLTALYLAFGLPFLLAPVAGLLLSWWLVRREAPWLILWVLFGVAIAPLPGQIFIINDSIFQQHLFWPLFVSLFVSLDWRKWLVLAVLAAFQFVHPIGVVLLAGLAAAALLLAWADKPHRDRLLIRAGIVGLLAAVALWKALHFPDPYAHDEMSWQVAMKRWVGGVMGKPLDGLMYMWGAGLLIFVAVHVRRAGATASDAGAGEGELAFERVLYRVLVALAFACVVVGACLWVYWAENEQRWAWALEYRRWVVPLSVPFYALCWLDPFLRALADRATPTAGTGDPPDRARAPVRDWPACNLYPPLCVLLAGVFAVVLIIQSTLFGSMVRRLREDLRLYPGVLVPDYLVPGSPSSWCWHTAMEHWGTTYVAITIQGKRPKKLLVSPDWVRALYGLDGRPPVFPNYYEYPHPPAPNTNGWFDLRQVMRDRPPKPPFLENGEARPPYESPVGGPTNSPANSPGFGPANAPVDVPAGGSAGGSTGGSTGGNGNGTEGRAAPNGPR